MLEAWTLKYDLVKTEEEKLRETIRKMDDSSRSDYYKQYNRLLKDPDTYAVLNWFFLAGIHHFYLGKYLRGSINLIAMLLGILLLFTDPVLGVLVIVGIIVIELPALFRSQIIVANHNTKTGFQLLGE